MKEAAERLPIAVSQWERGRILVLLALGQATSSTVSYGISVLAQFIKAELSLTNVQVGLFTSVRQSSQVFLYPVAGWLSDRLGIRLTLSLAEILLGLSFVGLAMVPSYAAVLVVLLIAGTGIAFFDPPSSLAILRWFSSQNRGTAMGVMLAASPVGAAAIVAGLPPLVLILGWRKAALLCFLPLALAGIVTAVGYHDPVDSQQQVQRRRQAASLSKVFADRNLWILGLYAGLINVGWHAITSYFILYLRDDLGGSVVLAGTYLAGAQIGSLLGRLAWGVISDRLLGGRRKLALVLIAAAAASLLIAMAYLPQHPSGWWVSLITFGLGLSVMSWPTPFHSFIVEQTHPQLAATAIGLGKSMQVAGSAIGLPIFGAVADVFGHYRPAWLLTAGLAALAFLLVTLGLRERRP